MCMYTKKKQETNKLHKKTVRLAYNEYDSTFEIFLKVGLSPSKKNYFICFNDSA